MVWDYIHVEVGKRTMSGEGQPISLAACMVARASQHCLLLGFLQTLNLVMYRGSCYCVQGTTLNIVC